MIFWKEVQQDRSTVYMLVHDKLGALGTATYSPQNAEHERWKIVVFLSISEKTRSEGSSAAVIFTSAYDKSYVKKFIQSFCMSRLEVHINELQDLRAELYNLV